MPTVEFKCWECDHTFSRVVMRGEENRKAPCPKCQGKAALVSKPASGLFNGISNFSNLSKDTN